MIYNISPYQPRVHLDPSYFERFSNMFRSVYKSHINTSLQPYKTYTYTKPMVDFESTELRKPFSQNIEHYSRF